VRLARAAATFEWGWSADELERLVEAAGWTWREPSEGTVDWGFDAGVGAFVFRGEVTAIYQNLAEHDDAGVLARRDGFHRAVRELSETLGPPPIRVPGPDPSAGWPVRAGVLDVVDRPGALDLWLRPVARNTPQKSQEKRISPASWEAFADELATAAACLPENGRVSAGPEITIVQSTTALHVTTTAGATSVGWPAPGATYLTMATGLAAWLRDEAGHHDPAEIQIT
jgi:hypothetical protein